jgi:hypothetical protein
VTIELINLGTYPGDGTGDPIRTSFKKVNDNFSKFAPVAFSGEYGSLFGTPSLAIIATTGQYTDLLGLPSLGALASLSSINNSNWNGTPLSINNGGTGQTTFTGAFNALSPIRTPGDIIIGNAGGQSVKLSIGSNTNVLTVVNNFPKWAPPVGPGGYNSQIQFNSNGFFGGATAINYSQTGNYLTISSLADNGIPINIIATSGQTGDLLDFTSSGSTQGGLAKFTAKGSLYIQGNPGSASSLELSNTHFIGQYFQTKASNGAYGPYFKTVDGDEVRFYQANGQPIWSIGWGDDCFFHRHGPGVIHQHNFMNPCAHKVFNWWQDDDHWEACGFDWQTEPNVCRFGTHHNNGIIRELHFMTGGVVAAKIDAFQNFICGPGLGAIGQEALDGYVHMPSMDGPPLVVPTFFDGMCPFIVNQLDKKLHVSINGSWWHIPLVAGN